MKDRVVRIVTQSDTERQDLLRVLERTKATIEITWLGDFHKGVERNDNAPPMWLDLTPYAGMTLEALAFDCQQCDLNAIVAPKQID